MDEQVVVLLAVTSGAFDTVALAKIKEAERAVESALKKQHAGIMEKIRTEGVLPDEDRETLTKAAAEVASRFSA